MVFNSLGSNYNFKFVLKALFAVKNPEHRSNLISFLNKKYSGETVLLYKGREAIRLALDLLKLPKGSKVGLTGFTCYVVYKAIKDAGYIPELIDIDKTLNFSYLELKKYTDLKAVIVQNTLGIPCDIEKIKKNCLSGGIILIEDLAHSVGTIYNNGQEAGMVGDFTTLSFSQDKMIDAVSGGALIIRNDKYKNLLNSTKQNINLISQIKDRFYPLLTFKIRKTYAWGLGKALHYTFKKLRLLSQPLAGNLTTEPHNLPDWYCSLITYQFSRHVSDLNHRRQISSIYAKNINRKVIVDKAATIRFPILVDKRGELIKYLKNYGIYISDIWYDTPVLKRILNLPTHINVSVKQSKNISNLINRWLTTQ